MCETSHMKKQSKFDNFIVTTYLFLIRSKQYLVYKQSLQADNKMIQMYSR